MQKHIKVFGKILDKLIAGNNLSRSETREAFTQVLENEQPEMHQGAFLAAITAKGPTPWELAGVWEAIFELDTVKVKPETHRPLLDNCGTGMDGFKTFNISSAAALVGAAGQCALARHGARAITSNCGTVDLCEALGVDVECDAGLVKESIEKCSVGIFNGMSQTVHPSALFRILSRMSFGSILNIAASMANPVCPHYGVRGVYSEELILPVIRTMQEIGYKRAVVLHGLSKNGEGVMDELSPVAKTRVAELEEDGHIREYEICPEKLGIKQNARIEEIARGDSVQDEALRLLKIFSGKDKGTLYETVCLNAAPIFYVAGTVSSFEEGLEKSRAIIDSGQVLDRLCTWVELQNSRPEHGKKRLESLLEYL